ncbi:MAG: hypothetical protein N4A35_03960 [Flavobacteriales bacterium]|jgi:hypothetical protein|nr:hypothetical protein [Flavobacteriales bacterium]
MDKKRQDIIDKIFAKRNNEGLWELLPENHKHYPDYLHYVPNYRATLWTLILLAELKCDPNDERIIHPLKTIQNHFYDQEHKIYTLKEDHFPIPCLNGNMLFLDGYFNAQPNEKSLELLAFFSKYQRFDDGTYETPKNRFCSNKSCYGKHTCYWGVVKLLKGISFIPKTYRTPSIQSLRSKCIDFILKHQVCYSSRNPEHIMIKKLDQLTFPNFYKGDFLEILWILKRENVRSEKLEPAIKLLKSKQRKDGQFELERTMNNMITSVGKINFPNPFITERATEVLNFYNS